MKKSLILSMLILLSFASFASAKIDISEPSDIYNLGDKLYVTVIMTPKSVHGNFEVNLLCGANNSLNLYRVPAEPSFSAGEKQTISTYVTLTPNYVGQITRDCNLVALIGDEQISTKNFRITNEIFVTARIDKENYDPGETITLTLEAIKANGHPLNGFVEASGAAEFSKEIENGIVTETFAMHETTEQGVYNLNLFIYDKGKNNEILNQANTTISMNINQVPSFIQLSLGELEAMPGENFEFGVDLFDQAGKEMQGTISCLIVSPENEERQLAVSSGETGSLELESNATPGTWKLMCFFEDISEGKEFTLMAVPKVKFDFLNSILIVKNIGNAVYNKTIEIKIGEETKRLENLNIQVGEERRFNLKAPEGEYEITVSDDSGSAEKTLLLTGKAISVNDLSGLNVFSRYPIMWLFIILIIAVAAVVVFFKFKKKSFRLKDRIKLPFRKKNKEEKIIDVSKPKYYQAESSLVLKGEKNKSAVISLKIKNYKELKEHEKQELEKILSIAEGKRAMVEIKEDYIMIIFSPIVTKTFSNEILASKAGFEIFKKLNEHNKKFTEKIKFNIGINSGDLISSLENKKLKYTSVGNTILLAKKLADSGEGKLLITENIRRKLMKDLKVAKAGIVGKIPIYSILEVTDRAANKEKLQELLHRMKQEEERDKKG